MADPGERTTRKRRGPSLHVRHTEDAPLRSHRDDELLTLCSSFPIARNARCHIQSAPQSVGMYSREAVGATSTPAFVSLPGAPTIPALGPFPPILSFPVLLSGDRQCGQRAQHEGVV